MNEKSLLWVDLDEWNTTSEPHLSRKVLEARGPRRHQHYLVNDGYHRLRVHSVCQQCAGLSVNVIELQAPSLGPWATYLVAPVQHKPPSNHMFHVSRVLLERVWSLVIKPHVNLSAYDSVSQLVVCRIPIRRNHFFHSSDLFLVLLSCDTKLLTQRLHCELRDTCLFMSQSSQPKGLSTEKQIDSSREYRLQMKVLFAELREVLTCDPMMKRKYTLKVAIRRLKAAQKIPEGLTSLSCAVDIIHAQGLQIQRLLAQLAQCNVPFSLSH